MKKLLMMIGAAAVAVGANADTVTINGITWTYTPNEATKTLTLSQLAANTYAAISDIPWSLVITGVTYKVTSLPNSQFFNGNRLTGTELTIPDWVTSIPGNYTFSDIKDTSGHKGLVKVTVEGATTMSVTGLFKGCTALQTAWFKGASTLGMNSTFNGVSSIKLLLFGPNAKASGQASNGTASTFYGASPSNCKMYCPNTSTWQQYVNYTDNGHANNGVEVILYGEGQDLDLSVDEAAHTITATVATTNTLAAVLGSAQYFKSGMGLDTRINVTNALDIAAGTITASQLENATFNSLMLAVKTQAQLDSILGVVPASVPVSIDPTGATQNLSVSTTDGRKVYVLLPEGGTRKVKVRPDGLIISFF